MLRRVVKKKRFRFADARNVTRYDTPQFDWLVATGFVAAAGDDWYELTARGEVGGRAGAVRGLTCPRPRCWPARTPRPRSGSRTG